MDRKASKQLHLMREFFNDYVRNIFPARRAAAGAQWVWPGDEWADADLQAATWAWIAREMPTSPNRSVEYGPGSGKYTEMLLARTQSDVVAYEISDAFIEALQRRCAAHVRSGRLRTRLIDWRDNCGLLRDLGAQVGTIDLVLAIDVLMMMDFQSALVYLASAAAMLRPGGRLIATFADAGSESGFARMRRDLGRHSAFDGSPCTRFHWVDRSLLDDVLPRLGFGRLTFVHGPADDLDIARLYVSAELRHPHIAADLVAALEPSGDSTNQAETAS